MAPLIPFTLALRAWAPQWRIALDRSLDRSWERSFELPGGFQPRNPPCCCQVHFDSQPKIDQAALPRGLVEIPNELLLVGNGPFELSSPIGGATINEALDRP